MCLKICSLFGNRTAGCSLQCTPESSLGCWNLTTKVGSSNSVSCWLGPVYINKVQALDFIGSGPNHAPLLPTPPRPAPSLLAARLADYLSCCTIRLSLCRLPQQPRQVTVSNEARGGVEVGAMTKLVERSGERAASHQQTAREFRRKLIKEL